MATPNSPDIMINDMCPGFAPLRSEDLKQLAEIAQYRVDRRKAEVWAHTKIKFLVYDDTCIQEKGYDSEDEEGMLEYVTKLSLKEVDNAKGKQKQGEEDVEEVGSVVDDGNRESGVEPDCKSGFCSTVPAFPRDFKPRKFRLVQPQIDMTAIADSDSQGGPPVCSHYVAVSYCWPIPKTDENGNMILTPGTYQVRDLNGKVRTSRAPDDVLDRAIDFAISQGLPQPTESSPQEVKEEQQLGVQAMDVVYNRAAYTCGLLSATISTQIQLNSLAMMSTFNQYDPDGRIRWCGPSPAPSEDTAQFILQNVLDVLNMTNQDRWYTRAWVAQESLLAGDMLHLLIDVDPSLEMETFEDMAQAAGTDMSWSELVLPGLGSRHTGRSQRQIHIPVKAYQDLVMASKYWDEELKRPYLHGEAILHKAQGLHPIAPKPRSLAERLMVTGGIQYRERQTVDAAAACVALNSCECRDVQDKTVILANMCNFQNRLDTSVLGKRCKSLRIALFALTIMNGDYSLLVPESYAIDETDDKKSSSNGWLWPLDEMPHLLQLGTVYPAGFIRRAMYKDSNVFQADGISLGSKLWLIEDKIDLTVIQQEWKDKWDGIGTLKVVFTRREGETNEEYNDRRNRLTNAHFDEDPQEWKQIMDITKAQGYFVKEGEFGYELYLEPPQVKDPGTEVKIAEIVFAILRHLFLIADTEPRALGLANSIWHSVRTDVAVRSVAGKNEELPDDVGDWIFTDPKIDHEPVSYLQLDETLDGTFYQYWFIDRIMRDGFLWLGRCEDAPLLTEGVASMPPHTSPVDPECGLGSILSSELFSANNHQTSGSAKKKSYPNEGSILDRQMSWRIQAGLGAISAFNSYIKASAKESSEEIQRPTDGREVASMLWTFARLSEEEKHGDVACARNHVPVFDVDGPCMIAVPYNADWERLPRPMARSMAVCWIIEPVKKSVKETPGVSSLVDEAVIADEGDHTSGCVGRYRVLDKVRGLWKITLDAPKEARTFLY